MSSTNFNQIAKVYNLKGGYSNEIGSMIVNFINTQINSLNVDSCLEFGAGTGLVTEHVNGLFNNYYAVDISKNMLEILRENLIEDSKNKNIHPIISDVTDLPFLDNSFDFVFGARVLRYVGAWESALKEIKRVMKHGGLFIHIEEKWLENSSAQEVRPMWESILGEFGCNINRDPGPNVPNEHDNKIVLNKLKELGFTDINLQEPIIWSVESSPQKVIDSLSRGGGSSVLGIPEEIHRASIERLKKWAVNKWGINMPNEITRKCIQAISAKSN